MQTDVAMEHLALFTLLTQTDVKWPQIRAHLSEGIGPSEQLHHELVAELVTDQFDTAVENSVVKLHQLREAGIFVSSIFSEDFPHNLITTFDHPPMLYWMGHHDPDDEQSIAIIGTRNPSDKAAEFTTGLANRLAELRTPIVSGIARGIDAIAMNTSLAAGNRTIGVIGTGMNYSYPAENRHIQQIVAEDHLLISQFSPDTPGARWTFPMRNVVMSGFASMSIIVEAGEHSGTRTQARAAVGHGRPIIITRAVLNATDWAKDLHNRGLLAAVVHTPDEAVAAIELVRAQQQFTIDPIVLH